MGAVQSADTVAIEGGVDISESAIEMVTISAFLDEIAEQLAPHGFDADSTLAVVATCRDELCQPFIHAVRDRWGEAFDLNGLGGLPIGGVTALGAASHHAPKMGGRRRVLLIGMAHIALGESGEWGVASRQEGVAPSTACGALARLCGEYSDHAPEIPLPTDDDDVEYSFLRRRMWGVASASLKETTLAMAEAIHFDLTGLAKRLLTPDEFDYAVFSGILTHLSTGDDMVQHLSSTLYTASEESERIRL